MYIILPNVDSERNYLQSTGWPDFFDQHYPSHQTGKCISQIVQLSWLCYFRQASWVGELFQGSEFWNHPIVMGLFCQWYQMYQGVGVGSLLFVQHIETVRNLWGLPSDVLTHQTNFWLKPGKTKKTKKQTCVYVCVLGIWIAFEVGFLVMPLIQSHFPRQWWLFPTYTSWNNRSIKVDDLRIQRVENETCLNLTMLISNDYTLRHEMKECSGIKRNAKHL